MALTKKYKHVVVVLDRLNWDSLYRLYKYSLPVTVINLNSGYTWLGKKVILADMDDIYIKTNVQVYEIMDLASFDLFFKQSFEKFPAHIRVPYKDMEEKIWWSEIDLEYDKIIDFSEYGISGYSAALLSYGSVLQETLNAAWLLQAEGLGVDLFRLGVYKEFSTQMVKRLEAHDKVFVIGDFDPVVFRDFIYSKFCEFGLEGKEIHFVCPTNLKQVTNEFLSEQVKMQPVDIYNRIRSLLD